MQNAKSLRGMSTVGILKILVVARRRHTAIGDAWCGMDE